MKTNRGELIVKNEQLEIHKVNKEDFQKLQEEFKEITFEELYSVNYINEDKIVGLINIQADKSKDLSFEFKDEEIIVEGCNLLINHLKENGYEYITYTTNTMNQGLKEILRGLNMKYKYSYSYDNKKYRMYQTSVVPNSPYTGYWDKYPHYIESSELK